MSKKLLSVAKVLISVLLASFLLYLVFKNIDWAAFWAKAKTVELGWVLISVLISLTAFFSRAYRWNLLLEPLGYNLKTGRTTLAVMIGYLANLAIPRLGEVSRCGVLQRNDKVAMSHGLGSVVAERIMDLLVLMILIFISLLVEYERITSFLKEAFAGLNIPTYVVYILLFVGFLGVAFLFYVVKRRNSLKGKFADLIKSFVDGLLSLTKIKNVTGFVVSTLLIWIAYYLMSYVVVFSLAETSELDFRAGFLLLITGGIALSIPVQSGFGTYHGMVAGLLLLYGINKTTGLFFATLLHTSQIVSIALFGTVALILSSLLRRKANKAA
ncbi:MAG: lysylphosphatidylglycerol synthase transmembrane domain-containing protein [Bacteroidota bacterium]